MQLRRHCLLRFARTSMPRRRVLLGLCAALLLSTISLPARADGDGPIVFAAASLKLALDEIAKAWPGAAATPPKLSYAASSALARQIEAGAPANIFASADLAWMDYLEQRNLIQKDSRVSLLGNRLVLVAPKGHAPAKTVDTIEAGFPLARLLGGGRLAVGTVDAVPAGKYAKAALESLGMWDGVKDHLAQAESVTAALALVGRGETPLGIVYRTDAFSLPDVTIVGTFPTDSHPPILYPFALTATSQNPAAASFFTYIAGPESAVVFRSHGFIVLKE